MSLYRSWMDGPPERGYSEDDRFCVVCKDPDDPIEYDVAKGLIDTTCDRLEGLADKLTELAAGRSERYTLYAGSMAVLCAYHMDAAVAVGTLVGMRP